MASDELLRNVREGVRRGLSRSYEMDHDLPVNLKDLVSRLTVVDTAQTRRRVTRYRPDQTLAGKPASEAPKSIVKRL